MAFFLLRILGLNVTRKTGVKNRKGGQYEKLPKTLKELDPSYRALIRELAKR